MAVVLSLIIYSNISKKILLHNLRSGRKENPTCHGIFPSQIQVQYDELMFNTKKYSKSQDIDLSKFIQRVHVLKESMTFC